MEKKQLAPSHCSLHSWPDLTEKCSQTWSSQFWSSLVLFIRVMEGFVSSRCQCSLGVLSRFFQAVKWHLKISNWDCFYVNRETCETSHWSFRYGELGTIFGFGFWVSWQDACCVTPPIFTVTPSPDPRACSLWKLNRHQHLLGWALGLSCAIPFQALISSYVLTA